jgi:hypothetical protein
MLPALALGAALTWGTGFADPPAKPAGAQPDAEFLEFLGSVDSASEADDGSWMEYLAQADIDKASKKANPPSQRVDDRVNEAATAGADPSAKPAVRDDRPPTATQPATGDRPNSVPADKLAPVDKLGSDAKQGASKVKPDGQ